MKSKPLLTPDPETEENNHSGLWYAVPGIGCSLYLLGLHRRTIRTRKTGKRPAQPDVQKEQSHTAPDAGPRPAERGCDQKTEPRNP